MTKTALLEGGHKDGEQIAITGGRRILFMERPKFDWSNDDMPAKHLRYREHIYEQVGDTHVFIYRGPSE